MVDRGPSLELALKIKSNRKPLGGVSELSYVLSERSVGRALIIGTGGGRELRMALAHGHKQVDAIELSRALTGDLLARRYPTEMGHLLSDPRRVALSFGDGRRRLPPVTGGYQRIMVISEPSTITQIAPRLLMSSDRRHTAEAIAGYLSLLTPKTGNLVLRVPRRQLLPALMATAEVALALPRKAARERMFACSEREGAAMLLLAPDRINPRARRKLRRYCTRKRLIIEYPMAQLRENDAERDSKAKQQQEQLARLDSAVASGDAKPFLAGPPEPGRLVGVGLEVLKSLRVESKAKLRKLARTKRKPPAVEPPPVAPLAKRAGVAAVGVLFALALGLLALLLPVARTDKQRNPAATFRVAALLFGVAAALGMFSISELCLQVIGDRAYGWRLVLPMGLVGLGGGRLWVDALPKGRVRSYLIAVIAVAVPSLIGAHAALPMLAASAQGETAALLSVAAIALLAGWLLGAPLAAAMRLSGRHNPVAVASIWGVHLLGWALGGAFAAVGVYYFGAAKLLTLAAAALGFGALLFAASGRRTSKSPPSQSSLAQSPPSQSSLAQSSLAQSSLAAAEPSANIEQLQEAGSDQEAQPSG